LKPPGSFGLSDGIKEGVPGSPRVAAIIQSLEDALDEYERKRPQWSTETIFELLADGLQRLRTYIEDPNEEETSWSFPAAKLHYAVNWNWEEKRLESGVITDEDFEEKDHLAGKLKKNCNRASQHICPSNIHQLRRLLEARRPISPPFAEIVM
jgi:hypothetical protein